MLCARAKTTLVVMKNEDEKKNGKMLQIFSKLKNLTSPNWMIAVVNDPIPK